MRVSLHFVGTFCARYSAKVGTVHRVWTPFMFSEPVWNPPQFSPAAEPCVKWPDCDFTGRWNWRQWPELPGIRRRYEKHAAFFPRKSKHRHSVYANRKKRIPKGNVVIIFTRARLSLCGKTNKQNDTCIFFFWFYEVSHSLSLFSSFYVDVSGKQWENKSSCYDTKSCPFKFEL